VSARNGFRFRCVRSRERAVRRSAPGSDPEFARLLDDLELAMIRLYNKADGATPDRGPREDLTKLFWLVLGAVSLIDARHPDAGWYFDKAREQIPGPGLRPPPGPPLPANVIDFAQAMAKLRGAP
jgi:hypothetical protein